MKILKKLLIVIIVLLIFSTTVLSLIGFIHYKKALKNKSLENIVSNIKNQEHFIKIDEMSSEYRNAVICVEDHRFYNHGPVDFISIGRAIFVNLKSKEFKEGGSTITQQLAKNIVFNQENSWLRKLGEIFASYELEKNYSKSEIFELYVNTCYFGDNYSGLYNASYGYYKKDPKDLNLDEATMLAGIPNAPSVYSPNINPSLAKKRQKHVLRKMLEYGYITENEFNSID